jgi:class 3 adenylate cyclase
VRCRHSEAARRAPAGQRLRAGRARTGVHAADARRVGGDYRGRGVHEAGRIGALAGAGENVASAVTAQAAGARHSPARTVELKGVNEPVEVVSVDWR